MSRWRWVALGLVLLVYTFTLGVIGAVLCVRLADLNNKFASDDLRSIISDPHALTIIFLPAAIVTATQIVFLISTLAPRVLAPGSARSLWWSVISAALVAGVLFAGLCVALAEGSHLLLLGDAGVHDLARTMPWAGVHEWWAWWPYVLVSWLLWIWPVMFFARRQPGGRLHSRLIGWLLAGTVVELGVVIPIDVMVRRRTNCYCDTGTFTALCLSICALLWLTGPGIVLAVTSKRRKWWAQAHCINCGYEKGPSPGDRCPECGAAWREAASG